MTRTEKLIKSGKKIWGKWSWENGEEIFLIGHRKNLWVIYFREKEGEWFVDEFYINRWVCEKDLDNILANPDEFVRYFDISIKPPTATFIETVYWILIEEEYWMANSPF